MLIYFLLLLSSVSAQFDFFSTSSVGKSCKGFNNESGSCSSLINCSKKGGIPDGHCPDDSSLICCVEVNKCGASLDLKETYLANSGFPNSIKKLEKSCSYFITKKPNIGFIKVEFKIFKLAPPIDGHCKDQLIIDGIPEEAKIDSICGQNDGQHIFIDVAKISGPINVRIILDEEIIISRKWLMKITQLKEADPFAPIRGCLQYFTQNAGEVFSFNYHQKENDARGNIAGIDYGICIPEIPHHCSIELTPDIFELSPIVKRTRRVKREVNETDLDANSTKLKIKVPNMSEGYRYPIYHFGEPENLNGSKSNITNKTTTTLLTRNANVNMEALSSVHITSDSTHEQVELYCNTFIQPDVIKSILSIDPSLNKTINELIFHCEIFKELEEMEGMEVANEIENRPKNLSDRVVKKLLKISKNIPEVEKEAEALRQAASFRLAFKSSICDGQDSITLPPMHRMNNIFCGRNFNNGNVLQVFTKPLVIHVRNMEENNGLGFKLKYKHIPC